MKQLLSWFAAVALVLMTVVFWIGRAKADPCFDMAANAIACESVAFFPCDQFKTKAECEEQYEWEFYVDYFECLYVFGSQMNCVQAYKDGKALEIPCKTVYPCIWSAQNGCIQDSKNGKTSKKSYYFTEDCN